VYLQFFELTEAPFSITPDPAFVYLSAAHREALAHLLYGVGKGGAGGFVQLTGEVGTGKTTICRCLLEQLPADTRVALILNPMVTPRELLATICEELGVRVEGWRDSSKALVDALNHYLLLQHAAGKHVVVVIDEAQNLSPEALEQVRLLTNLETAKHKLLQMVLLGQPELRQLLQRQNLRQLAQRVTARYHLAPLAEEETQAYVRHRMRVAGARQNPFKRSALRALHQRSGGVPRLINIIADRALAGAYAREVNQVTARLVHAAADEVQPSESRVSSRTWPAWLAAGSGLVLLAVAFLNWGLPWLERQALQPAEPAASRQVAASVLPAAAEPGASATTAPGTQPAAEPQAETDSGEPSAVATGNMEARPEVSEEVVDDWNPAWRDRQHDRAFAGLAELWEDAGSAEAIRAACAGQAGTGYACLREYGSWARVLQLGLPVILVLQDGGGRHVILRGLAGQQVLLGAGEDVKSLAREVVEPMWLGEYLVAWPQAPGWPNQIRRGETGTAVDIVLQMATLAEPAWDGGDRFDDRFESWLLAFQRRHGLIADGIIGPKTLLYLMAPGISEPRLLTSIEERS
jgi:general secretion pathway protein A